MEKEDFKIECKGGDDFSDCGWYIVVKELPLEFLWKDLQLHNGTGYWEGGDWGWGGAPGYYPSKRIAEAYLNDYLDAQDKVAHKPEYNGVLLGDFNDEEGATRVFFKVTDAICEYKNKIVALNKNGSVMNCDCTLNDIIGCYKNIRILGD